MTRFAILGNCQAAYVAQCVRFLAPGCEVNAFLIFETSASTAEFNKIVNRLTSYDCVLAQPQLRGNLSALTAFAGDERRIVYYPSIEFTAYHPDLVYILRTASGSVVKSPVGDYHSALAFLCYSVGLNAEQTVARFNERVFARLGYFANSLWTTSERNLLDSGRNTGLPVERYFRSWVRRGCFMYSVNHPKLFVLADLAAGALASCGVTADPRLCEDYVPNDILLGPVWPVYPEIAARFGLNGSYHYKEASAADGTCPYFDLKRFVETSFIFYRNYKLAELSCQRVEAWKGDPRLVDYIVGDADPSPVADLPESGNAMPPADGASPGLPSEMQNGLCILDWINSTPAAAVREVSLPFGHSTVFSGWALDVQNGTVAGGVDIVIDGVPYRATYGIARSDVAKARGNVLLESSGFRFSLGPGALRRGVHSVTIRVLTRDCRAYYEGYSVQLIVD